MIDLSQILDHAKPLVRETGQWIQSMVNTIGESDIQYKGTNDLVSFVDQQAESRLKGIILTIKFLEYYITGHNNVRY